LAEKNWSILDPSLGKKSKTGAPLKRLDGAMIRTCGWPSARRRKWAHLPEDDLKVQ
jgi:hypothetical protein